MIWFLFQGGIIVGVVYTNVLWHWADAGIQVGIVGLALAWLATVIAKGVLNVLAGRPFGSLPSQ